MNNNVYVNISTNRVKRLLCIVILTMFMASPAAAQWSESLELFPDQAVPFTDLEDALSVPIMVAQCDSQGRIHLIWIDDNAATPEIFYSVRSQCTWSAPLNISRRPGISFMPNLAIDSHDGIHCAWTEWNGDTVAQACYTEKPANGSWSEPIIISDTTRYLASYPVMAIDANDNIHFMWSDYSQLSDYSNRIGFLAFRIKYANNEWSDFLAPPLKERYPFRPEILFDKQGRLHCLWYDSIEGLGRSIQHSAWDGASWSATELVAGGWIMDDFGLGVCMDSSSRIYCVWYDYWENYSYLTYLDENQPWSVPISMDYLNRAGQLVVDQYNAVHCVMNDMYNTICYQRFSNNELLTSVEHFGKSLMGTDLCPYPELIICNDTLWCFSLGFEDHARLLVNTRPLEPPSGIDDGDISPEICHEPMIRFSPNPFRGQTRIEYHPSVAGLVRLAIFDVLGREVVQLVNDYREAKPCQVEWDGSDHSGHPAPAGIYFYRLECAGQTATGKLMRMK